MKFRINIKTYNAFLPLIFYKRYFSKFLLKLFGYFILKYHIKHANLFIFIYFYIIPNIIFFFSFPFPFSNSFLISISFF